MRLVDLTLVVHHRTERGIKVSETGDEAKTVWLPLSQIEVYEPAKGRHKFWDIHEITMPERLATEKGLV